MTWKTLALGDGIHVKHGFAFKGDHFVSEGRYVVLTPGNFYEAGGFRSRPGKDRFYAGDIPDDYVLHEGDIVVAMTEQGPGLLGSSALVPLSDKYLHNQRLGLIDEINPNVFDKQFLFYLFNTRSLRAQISGSASGTKVRHTAPERIYRVKVRIPDGDSQHKIGKILRAYDELITNNRRRIELLEQSVRLLFKEWFVSLKYPGHERDRIVRGVPQGWSRKTLGEVAVCNSSSHSVRSLPPEINYIDISSVAGGLISRKTRVNAEGAPGRARRKTVDGDIVWSNVRPNLRQYALVLAPDDEDVFSTGFTVLSAREVPFSFLYVAVTTDAFVSYLVNQTTGASYPAVRPEDFARAELLIPTELLLGEFHIQCEPMLRLARQVDLQNKKLTEARDLLLPRLMDGRLEV